MRVRFWQRSHQPSRYRRLAAQKLEARQLLTTLATFDHPPTPYVQSAPNNLQFTSLRTGGPTGTYMKFSLAEQQGFSTLSFDRTDAFAADTVVAEFMFRDIYTKRRTDSFDFALLNTSDYGAFASPSPVDIGQGFKNSLSFRFLINRDINDFLEEWNDSSIQILYNGSVIHDIVLDDILDLQSGQWHRARFVINAAAGTLSADITPEGMETLRVGADLGIPGLVPYPMRAHFANSKGTNAGSIDLDSIAVNYLKANESYVTFDDWRPVAQENAGPMSVTMRRFGNLSSPIDVRAKTTGGNAKANSDYEAVDELVHFAAGQDAQSVDLAMIDDAEIEENEYFWLRAISTSASVKATDPMASIVRIYDDETGRDKGQTLPLFALGRVPIHTVMFPDGSVMFWGRQHDLSPLRFNPATGVVTSVAMADDHHGAGEHFNIFCSGHTLLPDGRLFIAGGHIDDTIGLKTAFLFDPTTDHWTRLPDMSEGRWYPTALALPNGDVLVLHGTIDSSTNFNEQPEVWQAATNTWRKINISQDLADNHRAHQSNYYPRVMLAPDGRIFYFGVAGETWFLDVQPGVTNPWTAGPKLATHATPNDYGTVTEYAPGKLLVVGGGVTGKADAEVIDLNQANPQFRAVSPMAFARRQHNATILPDGRVLITGGHAGAEQSNPVEMQYKTEIWDPVTEKFTIQNSLSVERIYHSTGLLMANGSVWTGGTGEPTVVPNSHEQRNAQFFHPSYMYYANRPEITFAPKTTEVGEEIYITTKRPLEVNSASLIRLGSVTHALEQSAKFIPLTLSQSAGGLNLKIPANTNTVIPGFYHLTVVDYRGVPSESKIIQILPSGSMSLVNISNATATESANGIANLTVQLTKALSVPTTINYRTLTSSAKPGLDFVATEQSITIPAGALSGVIGIPLVNDATKEPSEWFSVDLFSATGGAVISRRRAHAVVRDDDGETPPTLSIADASGPEGGYAYFTVSLTSPSVASTFVPYATYVGTAGKQDFAVTSSSISIPAGSTSGQIRVPITFDEVNDAFEAFFVRIIPVPALKLGDGQAVGTIIEAPLPTLTPENLSIQEGTGGSTIASIMVRLSSALNVPASVNFATQNLSAQSGSDYLATSGTLVFQPGETVKVTPITLVADSSREGTEEFFVNFSAPSRAKLSVNQIKVKILNDD